MQDSLKAAGIGTGIHYPIPLHLQKAYRALGYEKGDFPVTEKVASEILSLPMYPQLTRSEQENVVQAVRDVHGYRPEDSIPRAAASNRSIAIWPYSPVYRAPERRQNFHMTVYEIDPTRDERWDELLQNHPDASIFHTRGWLEALRRTYGYQPVAFTTSPPGHALTNGILFCQISSWLSRRRLVSLPFSDHCAPLVENPEQLTCLLANLQQKLDREGWSYIETRATDPVMDGCRGFGNHQVFWLHKLDLRPTADEIFQRFHHNCIQRKIRRAAREKLTCEEGTSDSLVSKFYDLLLMTRRRHGLPAQPRDWFRNIIACVGDKAKIRIASKDGRPIAGILTLRYKRYSPTSMVAPIAGSVIWAARNCCSGTRFRKPSRISFPNLIWAAAIGTTQGWPCSRIAGAPTGPRWFTFDILCAMSTAFRKERKLALGNMSGPVSQEACWL